MKDVTPLERWNVMLVQARRFAAKENHVDAVARARLVCRQVDEALALADDGDDRRRLEALRMRAGSFLRTAEADLEVWTARLAAMKQARVDNAAEEMARPLPNAPPER